MSCLNILSIFVKQRTYLITLHSFDHLAQSLLAPEQFEKDETQALLYDAASRKGDLVSLLRFLRTFV